MSVKGKGVPVGDERDGMSMSGRGRIGKGGKEELLGGVAGTGA